MPRRNQLSGCLLGSLAILGGIVLLCGLAFVLWYQYTDRGKGTVDRKLADLRRQGLPVDNETLTEWVRARSDSSNSERWIEIGNEVTSESFLQSAAGLGPFDRSVEGTRWTPQSWPGAAASRSLLKRTESLRNDIHSLCAERVPVWFDIPFASIQTPYNRLIAMQSVAQLIAVEFDAAIADDDSPQMLASIRTLLRLAVVCRAYPGMQPALLCTGIRRLGFAQLRVATENNRLRIRELDAISAELPEEALAMHALQETFQGERAYCLPMFFDLNRYQDVQPRAWNGKVLAARAGYTDILNYLDIMERWNSIDTRSLDQARIDAEEIEDHLDRSIQSAGWLGLREWIVTGLAAPGLQAVVRSALDESIEHRLALHAIAVRRYRALNGAFPEDLAALEGVGFNHRAWMPPGGLPMGYAIRDEQAWIWATIPEDGAATSSIPPDTNPDSSFASRRLRMLWRLNP